MPWHTVRQGEWLQQIACAHGFPDESKIYNHPDNADLKKTRPESVLLKPGDRVFIPALDQKKVSCATDATHHFALKRPKTRLRIKIQEDGQVLDSQAFTLALDGKTYTGTSDADGLIEVAVPVAHGSVGQLEVAGHVLPVRLSHLDPLEELTGVKARLHNLGFDCGAIDEESGEHLADALMQFQKHLQLEATGALDDATRDALKQAYGC